MVTELSFRPSKQKRFSPFVVFTNKTGEDQGLEEGRATETDGAVSIKSTVRVVLPNLIIPEALTFETVLSPVENEYPASPPLRYHLEGQLSL